MHHSLTTYDNIIDIYVKHRLHSLSLMINHYLTIYYFYVYDDQRIIHIIHRIYFYDDVKIIQ